MSAELSRIDYPTLHAGGGSSVHYDYSGGEELRKRQDAVSEMASKRFQALYAGDIPSAIEAGNRIRELRNSMSGIDPVRVSARSSESRVGYEGPSVHSHAPGARAAAGDDDDDESAFAALSLPSTRKGQKGSIPTDVSENGGPLKSGIHQA